MQGSVLGAWRIEERLGEGGMGTVYAARHTVMGRRGAVKVLRPEMSKQPDVVQRFFNEARAAAAIASPGIVDVLDMGYAPDGTAYLVMELLEGEGLSARLRRTGAMAPDAAARIGRQIAMALAAAHERGIIHRDLKPDNIFLVPDPEATAGERAKLLDFGIAKLHGDLAADAPITRTGALFGTPLYMSPEQCKGDVPIDHRVDLYALGCILYQLVCGRVPFLASGLGALLSAHMTEPPVPPRTIQPGVPEALEEIILCLLAKDPAHRFGSARAAANALDAALGRPVSASAATAPTIAAAEPDAPQVPTTLGGAAGQAEPAPRPSSARWPLVVAGLAVATIAAVVTGVIVLGSGGSGRTVAATPALSVDAAALTAPTYGLDYVAGLEAVSGSKIASYMASGAWDAAAEDFEKSLAQPDAPARWRAGAELCRGFAASQKHELSEARRRFEAAIAAEPGWATAHVGLSGVLNAQGERDRAIAAAHEAQRLAPRWWMPVAVEARVHRRAGALDRAIEHYQRALQIAPAEPLLLAELALVYHARRLDSEAERFARDALARDPNLVAARLLLAERALERKDGKEALAEATRVVALDPDSAPGALARADALLLVGQRDEARQVFAQLVALVDRTQDPTVPAARIEAIRAALARGRTPSGRRGDDRSSEPRRRPIGDRSSEQGRFGNDPLGGL